MFTEKHPIHPNARDYTLPAPGERAVLFIHGFASSPYHFRDYAEFFNKAGVHVRVLRLPGHGSHVSDLAASSHQDWREAVHGELQKLAGGGKQVFILGYSFGANLALDAAWHYPQAISGLVLVSPVIFLRGETWLRLLARFFDRYTKVRFRRKPWVRRRQTKEYQAGGSYTHLPIKSVMEFFYFIDNFTKAQLADIKTPTLILQPEQDPLVPPRSAEHAFAHLGTTDKKLVLLNSNEHTILSDNIRRQAFEEALDFISKH